MSFPTLPRWLVLLSYGIGACLSVGLLVGSVTHLLPFEWKESIGFITGAWGVWLQVKESHWNWPVQLVSSVFYVVVFLGARLYADTSLNVLYIVLYGLGWYWWLRGGEKHSELHIGRTSWRLAVLLTVSGAAATAGMTVFLTSVRDSAPFLDALTTVMSLVALLLTGRKLFECWWVWLAANLIYIGLYASKGLPLTAVLYALFAVLSVAGLLNWRRLLAAQEPSAQPAWTEPRSAHPPLR